MNFLFKKIINNTLFIITVMLAGICLFVASSSLFIEHTAFNSKFHENLFIKNNIYFHTQKAITTSLKDFINNNKSISPLAFEQNKEVFKFIENSTTPKMVESNLNSIREESFQYIKDERMILPDIYLNKNVKASKEINISNTTSDALTKIDKINLGAILLYINRSDISDSLSVIKLLYFMISLLPRISLLFFALLLLVGLVISKKHKIFLTFGGYSLLIGSLLCIVFSAGIMIYSHYLLPNNLYPLNMTIPLQNDVILAYIRDIIKPIYIFLIINSIVQFGLSLALLRLPKIFPNKFDKTLLTDKNVNAGKRVFELACYFTVLAIVITSLLYNIYSLRWDFEAKDYSSTFSKLLNNNTVTQVISAKDQTIYDLELIVTDKESGSSIKNLGISVNGKSDIENKSYIETKITDDDGIVKFKLSKGNFRLGFNSAKFPAEYILPSPFFTELKTAGTTIITIQLDSSLKKKKGFVELEVLDKDNKPLENLKMTIEETNKKNESIKEKEPPTIVNIPDKIFSYTNTEGIAIFKIIEGKYKISFLDSKFPSSYVLPKPIDVSVTPESLVRYTIRLVEKKQ